MEGPFGGPGGGQFKACGAPIRSIEIQYESDPSPLIRSLLVREEDYWAFECPRTKFGDETLYALLPFLTGIKEKQVCL
jgi:hypothetical protein